MNTERFLSEHGSNGIIKQQLTALASALWAPRSINNKRIIYQQLLFWTLQAVIYDKFSSSLSLSFFCLKMSKNALRWQDGKMASEISNFLARTQEIFFGKSFFPAYARGICKKLHFKLHPTPSFRHLIAQHPLTPIDTYRSSDRKRATVALLSFHCFAWLSLLCLFLVSLNCRRLLSRRFKPKSVIRPPIVILPSYRDFPAPFRFSVHHLVPRFFSP